MFKCNCPHETRAGCFEPRCPHYDHEASELGRKLTAEEYDKLRIARIAAQAECERAYAIWSDSADRLKRIEMEMHELWLKLLGTVVEENP